MVYFEKSQPAPTCLATESVKAAGNYNCGDVVPRLRFDFKNKCYICEQANITSTETEHFEPNIAKRFDWDNLFLSCSHCNNTKSDKYFPLLNCTIKSDGVDSKLHYGIIYFPVDDVKITALENDEKTLNTRDLLFAIYNGTTERKQIEAENIKASLLEEIIVFNSTLQKYYKYRFDAIRQARILEDIQYHLNNASAFTAFKRWIIRDSPALRNIFEKYIID